jgi:hypothetical protein
MKQNIQYKKHDAGKPISIGSTNQLKYKFYERNDSYYPN